MSWSSFLGERKTSLGELNSHKGEFPPGQNCFSFGILLTSHVELPRFIDSWREKRANAQR